MVGAMEKTTSVESSISVTYSSCLLKNVSSGKLASNLNSLDKKLQDSTSSSESESETLSSDKFSSALFLLLVLFVGESIGRFPGLLVTFRMSGCSMGLKMLTEGLDTVSNIIGLKKGRFLHLLTNFS